MFLGASVIVIVPARDEEALISQVIETMPAFVDRIIIVDDASRDGTIAQINNYVHDARISVVAHDKPRGVGGAIVSGYRAALARPGAPNDALCVMAGDGQMSPDDLEAVVRPIASDAADYVKGNRFADPNVARVMPKARYWGGRVLSRATSAAAAIDVHDSQCGFTAIARSACARLDLAALWTGYGYPNDLIGQSVLRNFRITEVAVRPVYARETSRLRAYHAPIIAALILRVWIRRRMRRLRRAR